MSEKYTIDNAKNDIQNLQDQNSYDFQEIKRLDGLIKEYDKKILQAINFNNLINKKNQDNQDDYEKIKEIKTQIALILDKIKHLEDNTTSGSGGSGLTITQTNQLNEAYTHSQSYHVSKQEIPSKTSQLINDSGFVNSSYVTNAINNAQLGESGSGIDLNIYATKEEVAKITEENHNFLNEKVSVSNNKNVQFIYDVEGNPINCHGMGILYYNGVYYAYGESKTGETRMGSTGYEFIETSGINCYSSTDLVNWKFENKVIKPNEDDTDSIIHKTKVMERPKCVYNEKNNNFVLMWHADNEAYSFSRIGFATCNTPTGEFTVIGSSRPTTNDTTCRDFTVFVDDDKKAYAFISQDGNSNMYAHLLNDDYTGFTTTYAQVIGNNQLREAPALFKYNNEYYILSSGCTGWKPNPSKIHKSSTILGTYEEQNNPCKNDTNSNSYGGQSTYVIKVDPNKFNCEYIACFDQWNKTDLEASTYLWLPLVLDKSDNKFYVDNVNNKEIHHTNEIRNRKYLISDSSNYFYNKTIDQAIQSLYELLQNSTPSEPIVATDLKVSPSESIVYVGKNKTFTCVVTPSIATSTTNVTWSVNNGNANISPNGKSCTLTGVTGGSVILTATSGNLTSTATVTIAEATDTPEEYKVFSIDSSCYNSGERTLTDSINNISATIVGTPTVSNSMINFTASDTFSFDISTLNLSSYTLRVKYQYTANANNNIITIGQGKWDDSFTFYQNNNKILFNGGNATVTGNTVGGSGLSAVHNVIGDYVDASSDIEIVLSYNSTTKDIKVWINGSLAQDGILSKNIYTSLTKLCNTEGNSRFVGGYKLIELYDNYYSSYPTFV